MLSSTKTWKADHMILYTVFTILKEINFIRQKRRYNNKLTQIKPRGFDGC